MATKNGTEKQGDDAKQVAATEIGPDEQPPIPSDADAPPEPLDDWTNFVPPPIGSLFDDIGNPDDASLGQKSVDTPEVDTDGPVGEQEDLANATEQSAHANNGANVHYVDGVTVAEVDHGAVLRATCIVTNSDGIVVVSAERAMNGAAFTVWNDISDLSPELWSETLGKISNAFDSVRANQKRSGDYMKEVAKLIRDGEKCKGPIPQHFYAFGRATFVPENIGGRPGMNVQHIDKPDEHFTLHTDADGDTLALRVATAYASAVEKACGRIGSYEAKCVEYPYAGDDGTHVGSYNVRVSGDASRTLSFESHAGVERNAVRLKSESSLAAVTIGKLCKQFYNGEQEYCRLSGDELLQHTKSARELAKQAINELKECSEGEQVVCCGMVLSRKAEGDNEIISVQGVERGDKMLSKAFSFLDEADARDLEVTLRNAGYPALGDPREAPIDLSDMQTDCDSR